MSYCNMPVITRTIRVICTPPKLSGNRRILLFEMRRLRDWAVDLLSSIIGAICRRRVLPFYRHINVPDRSSHVRNGSS